jgi:hypothetical protein
MRSAVSLWQLRSHPARACWAAAVPLRFLLARRRRLVATHVSLQAAVVLVARSLLPVARAVLLLVVTCSCSVLLVPALSCLLLLWLSGTRVRLVSRLGRLGPILARFRSAAARRQAVRGPWRWLRARQAWTTAQV